jgi:hypothetical protein
MWYMHKPVYVYPFTATPRHLDLKEGKYIKEITYDKRDAEFSDKDSFRYNGVEGREIFNPPSPELHWLVSLSEDWKAEHSRSLHDSEGVRDLVITLNLCVDQNMLFSNSHVQAFHKPLYGDFTPVDLSSHFGAALFPPRPPENITLKRHLRRIFADIDFLRRHLIEVDDDREAQDLNMALALYETAHQPQTRIEARIANLFFACENVLESGRGSGKRTQDELPNWTSEFEQEGAETWRNFVKRVKHPDKGEESIQKVIEDDRMPEITEMKAITNRIIVQKLNEFTEY